MFGRICEMQLLLVGKPGRRWARAGPLALGLGLAPRPAADSDAGGSTTTASPAGTVLRFQPHEDGGFMFDTGLLKGRLRAGGRSIGLTEVIHVPSGARLEHGYGLLSHYRVFANGRRYGAAAWDWPGTARLLEDGRVEVLWPATEERPFELRAVYRLARPGAIMVETRVEARQQLRGFEVFLASYFDAAFTNAYLAVKRGDRRVFQAATLDRGEWQMFPRDPAARALAEDGRWVLEPHPVTWSFPAELSGPVIRAHRRAPTKGLYATFNADTNTCFAVAMPHQTEPHYSTYLSLFGRTLAPGEKTSALVSLLITGGISESAD